MPKLAKRANLSKILTNWLVVLFVLASWPFTSLSDAKIAAAQGFADPAFGRVWERTDQPVAAGIPAGRSWFWGPVPGETRQEEYGGAGRTRLVQYFDKSRMEINDPAQDPASPWFVTNGLLARELVSGQLQLGDSLFRSIGAAAIPVAGDSDDLNTPTYADFAAVTTLTLGQNKANRAEGAVISVSLERGGRIGPSNLGESYNVRTAFYEAATAHNIAAPFWEFLNSSGPLRTGNGAVVTGRLFEPLYFVTGLPLSEAYWMRSKVAGQVKDVLVQVFERRVLTYTPLNEPAWRVEMGNIGQHYYCWRYASCQPRTSYDVRFGLTVTGNPNAAALDAQLAQLGGAGSTGWYSFDPLNASRQAQANRSRVQLVRTGVNYTLKNGPADLQNRVKAAPASSYWLIGNEPNVPGQDNATPADYARQYGAIRQIIRTLDPTAKMVGPNILNWNYTCNGCDGYAQADGWVTQMMQAYRQQTGREVDFEVWGIHTYGLNWSKLPLADYRQDISQVVAFRQFLNKLPAQANKPIWLTEFGVIWGYNDIRYYEDKQGNPRVAPAGQFQRQALLDYVGGYADWLLANATEYRLERWFIYTNFGLPEPYSDAFSGISLFDGAGSASRLNEFGRLYRSKAGQG